MNLRVIFTTILLFGIVNSEVHICFERTKLFLHDDTDVSSEQVKSLIQAASTELEQTLKSNLGLWTNFSYTYYNIDWHHDAFTVAGNITNSSVSIGDPVVKNFTPLPDGFEIFNLTLPFISINGNYNIFGYVGKNRFFDIFGSGPFHLELSNFSVALTTDLRINSSSLCILVDTSFEAAKCTNTFENIMDGDKDLEPLMNKLLQNIIPDVIRILPREIIDCIDPIIQWVIDKILHGNAMQNFMQLLGLLTADMDALRTYFKEPLTEDFERLQ
ncbi:uncharacterized protein [Euwallacea fornicatus]|uniref:uncharacterized protein n=1 Tax=Euwallacea fornicatus TaxID=995702 RepID=UPI0033905347